MLPSRTTSLLTSLLIAAIPANALAAPSTWSGHLSPVVTIEGTPFERSPIADRMAHYKVPAVSVAVIDHCEIVETSAFGARTTGGAAITSRSKFQAGSISKTATALAALRLVERGKLSLDRDVRHSVPGWHPPAGSPEGALTLRQLLSHTGGISVHGFEGFAAGQPLPTLEQVLNGQPPANSKPIGFEALPGSRFAYSGGGYLLVQGLMIQAAGQEFPTLMRRLVLQPARMNDSSFVQPEPGSSVAYTLGHDRSGKAIEGGWKRFTELSAAGLWTTPTDLAKLDIAIMRSARGAPGSLLRKSTAKEMLTAQAPGEWGLGVELRRTGDEHWFLHTGENDGFLSVMAGIPRTCSGIVVMTNGDGGAGILREVVSTVAAERGWPEIMPARHLRNIAATDAARLVGTYAIESSKLELEIRQSPAGEPLFYVNGAQRGVLRSESSAGALLVTSPSLDILAAVKPTPDGSSIAIDLGGRRYVATKRVPR